MLHISIKAEPIFRIGDFTVTNSFIASVLTLIVFSILAVAYRMASGKAKKGKFFYFVTFILKSLFSFFQTIFGDKTERFYTLIGSLFIFILIGNWLGLLPGFGSILFRIQEHEKEIFVPLLRASTADINTTLGLALISVVAIQYFGIKYLGLRNYLSKFIDLKSPLTFFTGVLEIISEASRVISFAFRLFGNIFAGEVLLTVIAFLIPILASFPFLLLEVFIGLIQAMVFAMLTAVFINLAITKHH